MRGTDTKTALLDAGERLFADRGFAATSLRDLTAAAGTNLAAVNYHFGSKDALAKAVLHRRIAPINAERLRRLAALPARAGVAAIVRAFVEPPLTHGCDDDDDDEPAPERMCRVFGRLSVEQPPFLRAFLEQQFRAVATRFHAALQRVLPGLDGAAIWWRLHFVVGAMAHTLQNSHLLPSLSRGTCGPVDRAALCEQLVAFATGGLRAAAASAEEARR